MLYFCKVLEAIWTDSFNFKIVPCVVLNPGEEHPTQHFGTARLSEISKCLRWEVTWCYSLPREAISVISDIRTISCHHNLHKKKLHMNQFTRLMFSCYNWIFNNSKVLAKITNIFEAYPFQTILTRIRYVCLSGRSAQELSKGLMEIELCQTTPTGTSPTSQW